MVYYTRETLPSDPVLGLRRATINEFFLSSYTLSIYTGCEIGCAYCDGWAYNPLQFSETIRVPLDMPQRLAAELTTVDRGDLIAITALSDPYQFIEQTYRITHQVLEVLADAGQPCLLLTKSVRILDDLDLLQRIHEQSMAVVMTTLLTVDPRMATHLEGKAISVAERLEMLKTVKRAGLPVGVALLPIIPYVNDTNYSLTELLNACVSAGVDFCIWDFLHIPNQQYRNRINEILARIGSYPTRYYRDIYDDNPLPSVTYRNEMNDELLTRCDELGLPPRMPHRLFAGRLHPANEATLLLKHTAFRDAIQGRKHMVSLHRKLADSIYRGEATPAQIQTNPLYPILFDILGLPKGVHT